jgi:acyl-CoA synthetase (AMP-forming)/AMP-acid ligase II
MKKCAKILKYAKLTRLTQTRLQSNLASRPSKLSYRHLEAGNYKFLGATIYDRLEATASERPNDEAFKFSLTQTSFTYREVQQRIDEIAQNLLKHGFKRGDRLGIMLPNTPEFVLTSLAAASIGVVSVLLNPAYQLVEIEYMLKKTKCRGVVILDNLKTLKHYEILTHICPELINSNGELSSAKLPDLKHVILVNNKLVKDNTKNYKGTLSFADLERNNTTSIARPYVDINDDFAMLFTV